jgi:hypothetical protein
VTWTGLAFRERPLPQAHACIEGELPPGSQPQVAVPQAGERRAKVHIYVQLAPCRPVTWRSDAIKCPVKCGAAEAREKFRPSSLAGGALVCCLFLGLDGLVQYSVQALDEGRGSLSGTPSGSSAWSKRSQEATIYRSTQKRTIICLLIRSG